MWQAKTLEQCKGDSKSSWNTIKSILNWKSSGAPTKLFYKGEMKALSQPIADGQNEHFVNKIMVSSMIFHLKDQTN